MEFGKLVSRAASVLAGALMLAGCTTELGKFTVYSPGSLDLSGGKYVVDRSKKVTGVDSAKIYFAFPSKMLTYDQAFQAAMAKRPDAVGLADVTLTREAFWLVFGYCDFKAVGYPILKKEAK